MSYAQIEERVHSLVALALPADVSCTRGYHSPNQLRSVAVRPGRADRQAQGQNGRTSAWTIEISLQISSGLDLSEFHDDVLSIRESIVSTMDKYPTLNGMRDVTGATLTSISEPAYSTEGRVHTYVQTLFAEVKEYALITGGEYA